MDQSFIDISAISSNLKSIHGAKTPRIRRKGLKHEEKEHLSCCDGGSLGPRRMQGR